MPKTRPPLGVVPFEDRLAPAAPVTFFTLTGTSWFGAAQAFLRHQTAVHAPATPGVHEWRLEPVAVGAVITAWRATEVTTTAPEATPAAALGPVASESGNRGGDRDARPATEPRGSSLGPVADTPNTISALTTTTAEVPPADAPQPAPAAERSAPTTAGPGPVIAATVPAGRPLFASTDYVFLETESSEPSLAVPVPPAGEPLQPDEPQLVPAFAVEPAVVPEAAPVTPLAGLLPFNVADLEGAAQDLLTRVAGLGTGIVEELGAGSEYAWLGVGALAAAGAVYASRPNRRVRARTGLDGYDSVFARWEGANAVVPPS